MRVFIAGIDGYLGFPLALHLRARGHEVAGADMLLRREWVAEVGGISALPIASYEDRLLAWRDRFGDALDFSHRRPHRLQLRARVLRRVPARGGRAPGADAIPRPIP